VKKGWSDGFCRFTRRAIGVEWQRDFKAAREEQGGATFLSRG